ncbi:MAG: transcriptional regulator MraZ [Candidatus Parcubacteria bacterium]|nr:division/cell wall cluster transcriptional repressor MraZ [Patescibacteria group bacterium]BCX16220.1 MAG: transcriptional regulator MraZ [Candidatus Parcubacteria bacterium]
MPFLGEYFHNLDQKGRAAIPAKFREKISGGAIITRGLDHCLFVLPKDEWEKLAQKIIAMPLAKSDSRAFARLMLAQASEVEFDNQGRILIPEPLRRYAGLSKKIVVIGVYNRLEIWDENEWTKYKKKTESASEEIAEKLEGLGI